MTGKSNIQASLVNAAIRDQKVTVNLGPEGERLLADQQFP